MVRKEGARGSALVIALSVVAMTAGIGCTELPGLPTTKGTAPTTGDDDDDDATTSSLPPEPETSCDDEIDDDNDGLVDCDDDDCAAEVHCSWPTSIDFETLIDFDANALAELGGYGDCSVHITAPLERDRAETCDGCDRVFTGPFTFLEDDCPDTLPRPEDGGYGIAFVSDTQWEVYGRVETVWTSLGTAVDDGSGTFKIVDDQTIEAYGVEVGTLTTFFSFTPLD